MLTTSPRKAIWLYGIVSPATGESFFLEYCHLDKICFEDFIQRLAQEFPQYLNVIQMDGAPVHIAEEYSGSTWKFMQLEGKIIELDLTEYFLNQVSKILGILSANLH